MKKIVVNLVSFNGSLIFMKSSLQSVAKTIRPNDYFVFFLKESVGNINSYQPFPFQLIEIWRMNNVFLNRQKVFGEWITFKNFKALINAKNQF